MSAAFRSPSRDLYLEYQSVWPFDRIGSQPPPPPPPLPLASVHPHAPGTKRGGQHSLAGERAGGANADDLGESLAPCILCATFAIWFQLWPICLIFLYTIFPSSALMNVLFRTMFDRQTCPVAAQSSCIACIRLYWIGPCQVQQRWRSRAQIQQGGGGSRVFYF